MARLLSDLKTSLNLRLRDKSAGVVESADATDFFNRAIDKLKNRSEFPGTKQRASMHLFPTVYEYAAPSGYKGAIAFRSQYESLDFTKSTSRDFWNKLPAYGIGVGSLGTARLWGSTVFNTPNFYADDNQNETSYLLVNRANGRGIISIDPCDSLTTNGTWAASSGTDATNVTLDNNEFQTGSGSINFDADVSTSVNNLAGISKTLETGVDMSDQENKSVLFARVSLPSVTYVTSLRLRWGTDSSNYWEASATTQFSGAAFATGYQRVGFDWNGATKTGTPSAASITYVDYSVVYSSGQTDETDYRLDEIAGILPEEVTFDYYSSNFVKAIAGTYKASFTAEDDISILTDFQDTLLLYLALEEAFNYLRMPLDAKAARAEAEIQFHEFIVDSPSERTRPSDRYYQIG